MVVPHRIMQDQLMVPLTPIVTDGLFTIDDQRVDAQHLQSCAGCESGLAST